MVLPARKCVEGVSRRLGRPGVCAYLLAASQLPQSTWSSTINGLRIPTTAGADRSLSPAESSQLALAWRVARQAFQMPDVDPLADPNPAASITAPSQAVPAASSGKKVKFSAVIDQLDETEINMMTQKELDQAYANHTEVTGAEPPSERNLLQTRSPH